MRLTRITTSILSGLLFVAVVGARYSLPVFAQNPETMSPEAVEAKGREIIQQAITALGGPAYLGVRDIHRTGRLAIFDSGGRFSGYTQIEDFIKLPDKYRTEYYSKRNVIDITTAAGGWSMDRGGVSDSPPDSTEAFVEGLKRNLNHLFRTRLNEEGLRIRYSGTEIIDMRRAELVEVRDKEGRTMIIAFDQASHLPARTVNIRRFPDSRNLYEDREFYASYFAFDGVQTPKKVYRERNGRLVYEMFLETCRYNSNLPDSFFTRAALEERWRGKKK